MLTHSVIGPLEDGICLVGYPTPGSSGMTIVCNCTSEEQARREADRLNAEQIQREKDIRWVRELRGLDGVYPELESRGI